MVKFENSCDNMYLKDEYFAKQENMGCTYNYFALNETIFLGRPVEVL